MKKRKRRSGHYYQATGSFQAARRQPEELKPEELALYIRMAEKLVLPIIKRVQPGPAAAQFLLAQRTRVLVTGDPRLTVESGMAIANVVLKLWLDGYYSPGPDYPYTLLETLQDLRGGVQSGKDYSDHFQPFAPLREEPTRGDRQVAAGIAKHPETQLWQIWAIVDGPCVFFGAYADPAAAQRGLEALINLSRRGGTQAEGLAMYRKLLSEGDGEPRQLPFEMVKFLIQHLQLYIIPL